LEENDYSFSSKKIHTIFISKFKLKTFKCNFLIDSLELFSDITKKTVHAEILFWFFIFLNYKKPQMGRTSKERFFLGSRLAYSVPVNMHKIFKYHADIIDLSRIFLSYYNKCEDFSLKGKWPKNKKLDIFSKCLGFELDVSQFSPKIDYLFSAAPDLWKPFYLKFFVNFKDCNKLHAFFILNVLQFPYTV
jgi:hypothetical protein